MAAMAQTRKFRLVVVEGLDINLCQNQSHPDESPSLGYRSPQSCSTWWLPLLSMNNAGESQPPERLGAVFLTVSTGIGVLKILLWLLESSSLYNTFTNKAMPEPKINPSCKCKQKKKKHQTRRTTISTTLGHERTSHSSRQYQKSEVTKLFFLSFELQIW